jgi:hypothetical protein
MALKVRIPFPCRLKLILIEFAYTQAPFLVCILGVFFFAPGGNGATHAARRQNPSEPPESGEKKSSSAYHSINFLPAHLKGV